MSHAEGCCWPLRRAASTPILAGSVAAPIVEDLSDWPRGTLSLFVNGEVRNTTSFRGPARGIAQHGSKSGFEQGVHTASVRYSPAMRMLYVTLDGSEVPSLWAELDPADLGLGPKPMLTAGFTAEAPHSGEPLSIDIRKCAHGSAHMRCRAPTVHAALQCTERPTRGH